MKHNVSFCDALNAHFLLTMSVNVSCNEVFATGLSGLQSQFGRDWEEKYHNTNRETNSDSPFLQPVVYKQLYIHGRFNYVVIWLLNTQSL